MNDTSKAAAVMLAGIAAGVALGILYAPAKGRENREKLTNSVLNLKENVFETAAIQFDNLLNLADQLVARFKNNGDIYGSLYDDIEHAII